MDNTQAPGNPEATPVAHKINTNLSDLPGFAEAMAEELNIRNFSMLGLNQEIGGLSVKPMTLRNVALLSFLRNPFIVGGNPTALDVAQLLWIISPRYNRDDTEARNAFLAEIAGMDTAPLLDGIYDYLDDTFQDAPGGKGNHTPTVSFAASIVDKVAREYGWSEEAILETSLISIFQYLRIAARFHDPNAILFNRKSDKVKGDYIRKLNTEGAAANG